MHHSTVCFLSNISAEYYKHQFMYIEVIVSQRCDILFKTQYIATSLLDASLLCGFGYNTETSYILIVHGLTTEATCHSPTLRPSKHDQLLRIMHAAASSTI